LRSRGIGAQMLQQKIAWARSNGYAVFGLDVSVRNPRGQALYTRLGLSVRREINFPLASADLPAARKMELVLSKLPRWSRAMPFLAYTVPTSLVKVWLTEGSRSCIDLFAPNPHRLPRPYPARGNRRCGIDSWLLPWCWPFGRHRSPSSSGISKQTPCRVLRRTVLQCDDDSLLPHFQRSVGQHPECCVSRPF